MAAFEYAALNENGKTKRGVIQGDSEKHVRRQLRESGLTPLDVNLAKRATESTFKGAGWGALSISDEALALTTRLLSTLLQSGLPVDDALSALSRQAESKKVERVVLGVRAKILEGHSLADSMNEYPNVFPEAYRATVGAGEQTQHLPLVLARLAEHVENKERLQKSIRLAMVYPAVLTVTALLVVSGLLIYVVPEVVQIFEGLDRELPRITRSLIWISDFTRQYGFMLIIFAAILFVAFKALSRREHFRRGIHRMLIKIPVIGRLAVDNDISRFTRMLSIMLGSSVNMIDALTISSKSVFLLPLKLELAEVLNNVREGESLNQALGKTALVPAIVPHLVASGEKVGNLVDMLETAAQALEFRVKNTIDLVLSLLEPLLILIMGGIVLLIVIAIMLPIFDMNQLI